MRAIILFEQDNTRFGEVLLESFDVSIVSPSPAVHGVMHNHAICDIIVQIFHFKVVDCSLIGFACNFDDFIFDDLSILFDGNNHGWMQVTGGH